MPDLSKEELVNLLVSAPVALILIVALLGMVTSAGLNDGSAAVNASTTGYTTIDGEVNEIPQRVTVEATRGNALRFDGTSSVEAAVAENMSRGSWAVCGAAELGSGAGLNGTYDVVAYENASILLQYDAGQWSVYHSNGTHDGKATIDAPDPRTTGSGGFLSFLFPSGEEELRRVCGRYNATANELVVVRDGTSSSPEPLTTATTTRNVSIEWTGRLDEIRGFNTSVSNATLTAYGDDPVQPLPGTERVFRLMLDEGSGSSTTVYFAGTSASVGSATWADGIQGPNLDRGTDYELGEEPFSLRIVSGGYLEGAPVEYVTWDGNVLPFGFENVLGPLVFAVFLFLIVRRAGWIK